MNIYLDNAATTPVYKEVAEEIKQSIIENFGNPSSTHNVGRKAKTAIETARKNIASHFNISASEIIFTSSATEANNLILNNAVLNLGVKHIITSELEHHAVLNVVKHLQKKENIKVSFLPVDEYGQIDVSSLETLLVNSNEKTLVSLMYINNEIGNLLPIELVAKLCYENNALFHSDTVQAIGHYQIDLQKTPIDFITASAHKFHGTKGVGFMYVKRGIVIQPMFFGGEQEKGIRSSTENVHGIIGMDKALQISYNNLEEDKAYIQDLKSYLIGELQKISKAIQFNGKSEDLQKSTYTILNVRFPLKNDMLLFQLDLAGISVSGGSACQSGSQKGSHVLQVFLSEEKQKNTTSVRFSFSKFNTKEEIDYLISKLKRILVF